MMNWPNRITVVRILLLTPFVILMLDAREHLNFRYWALGVFAAMALCDALDGFLARRLNQRSRLGRILDPLADKLVLTTALVILTSPDWLGADNRYYIPIWATVTILSKDGVVLLGVIILHFMTEARELVRPSVLGKTATALSFLLVLATLLAPDFAWLHTPRILYGCYLVLAMLAAATSAAAGLDYIRRGSKMLAAHSGEERV